MIELEWWQWLWAGVGAILIGFSKTGIAGLGVLFVAIFANIFPARQAVGIVLPLLICGDLIAVLAYRRHAEWKHLWRLFPWTAAGVVAGYFVMDRTGNREIALMTGVILIVLIVVHVWRTTVQRLRGEPPKPPKHFSFAATMGIASGFTTMISNAAGPIMVLYLLAMRLPKMVFLGTGAIFFLVMNLFKVPFGVGLGIINRESLLLDLVLVPCVLIGAAAGRLLIGKIDQKFFEGLVLGFAFMAALRLLLFPGE